MRSRRDHVVGIVRVAGPDLAAVDQPAAIGLGRAGRGGEHVGAGIRLAEADAEAQFARGDARQDVPSSPPPGRSAGSSAPIAGRRSSSGGSARGAPASPRSRRSVRGASAPGRRISWARSCRSSPWRRLCGQTAAALSLRPPCGLNVPASISCFRKARTSWRSSLHSGGSSTGSNWKVCAHRCLTIPRSGTATARRRPARRPCGRADGPIASRCRIPRATPTAGASSGAACARR